MEVKLENIKGGDDDSGGDGGGDDTLEASKVVESTQKNSDKVQVRSMALKSDGKTNTFLCFSSNLPAFSPPFFPCLFFISFYLYAPISPC
jgi:hypothetical protein